MTSPSASSSSSLQRRLKPRTSSSGSGGGQVLSSSASFHAAISSPLAAATSSLGGNGDDDDPFGDTTSSAASSTMGNGLPLPNGHAFGSYTNGDTDSAPSSSRSPLTNNRHRSRDGLSPFVSLLDTDLRGAVSSPRAVPRSVLATTDEPLPTISIAVNGSNGSNGMTPPGSSPVLASPKLPVMMPIEEEDKVTTDDTFGIPFIQFISLT
jgi:hypothetical protein